MFSLLMFRGSLGFVWCGNTISFGPNSGGTIIYVVYIDMGKIGLWTDLEN